MSEDERRKNIYEICHIIVNKGLAEIDRTQYEAYDVLVAMMNLIMQAVEQTKQPENFDLIEKIFCNLIAQKKADLLESKDGES